LDGAVEFGREIWEVGAHAKGYNRNSIGICYIGGLHVDGSPKDTRTPAQRKTMKDLKKYLDYMYPGIKQVGHRDLSVDLNGDGVISPGEWMKACPCYDVATES
jgi:N-acetyl-anhydromuramyl-L-alanine amidase AmpD